MISLTATLHLLLLLPAILAHPQLDTDPITAPFVRLSPSGSLTTRCSRQQSRLFTLYRRSPSSGELEELSKGIDYTANFFLSYQSVFSTREEVEEGLRYQDGFNAEELQIWGGATDDVYFVANITLASAAPGEVYTCDFGYSDEPSQASFTVLENTATIPNTIVGVRVYPSAIRCLSQGLSPVTLRLSVPEGVTYDSRNFTLHTPHEVVERFISVARVMGLGEVELACEQLGETIPGPTLTGSAPASASSCCMHIPIVVICAIVLAASCRAVLHGRQKGQKEG